MLLKSLWVLLLLSALFPFSLIHAQTTPVITLENGGQLELMTILGRGALLDVIASDADSILALSTGGITVFDADLNEQRYISFIDNYAGVRRASTSPTGGTLTQQGGRITATLPTTLTETGSITVEIDLETGEQTLVDNPQSFPDDAAAGESAVRIERPSCYGEAATLTTADRLYEYYTRGAGLIYAYDSQTGEHVGIAGGFGNIPVDVEAVSDGTFAVAQANGYSQQCAAEDPGNGVVFYNPVNGEPVRFLSTVQGTDPALQGIPTHISLRPTTDEVGVARTRGFTVISQGGGMSGMTGVDYDYFNAGIAYSEGGTSLAFASAGRAEVWPEHWEDGLTVIEDVASLSFNDSIAFWQDVLLYVDATAPDTLRAYDVSDAAEIFSLEHASSVLAFDVQGDTLAVLHGQVSDPETTLSIYTFREVGTGVAGAALVNTFPAQSPFQRYSAIALNPSGSLVAIAQPNGDVPPPGTRLFSTETGEPVGEAREITLPIAFSADGTQLIGAYGVSLAVFAVP